MLRYNDEGAPAPLQNAGRRPSSAALASDRHPHLLAEPRPRRHHKGSRAQRLHRRQGGHGGQRHRNDAGRRRRFDAGYVGGYVAILDGTGTGTIRQISAVPTRTRSPSARRGPPRPTTRSVYIAVKAGNSILAAAIDSPTWLEETTAAIGFINQRAETVIDIRAAIRTHAEHAQLLRGDNMPFNAIGTASGRDGNIGYWSSGSRGSAGGPIRACRWTAPRPRTRSSSRAARWRRGSATSSTSSGCPFTGQLRAARPQLPLPEPDPAGRRVHRRRHHGHGRQADPAHREQHEQQPHHRVPLGRHPVGRRHLRGLRDRRHPEAINPSEGYVANWNNKAATADEGDNFGRQFRHIFILEQLAAENGWDRDSSAS